MWGVTDESSENPLAELWGLFKRDDDVSWQHKALCSQTDPEAFFPEKGGSTRDAKSVSVVATKKSTRNGLEGMVRPVRTLKL